MRRLCDFTSARVDLPLAGGSLAVAPLLNLRLAHARAKDAVHLPLDVHSLSRDLLERNWPCVYLRTQAKNRNEYLRRPDLGRRLSKVSQAALPPLAGKAAYAFVVADGLSALAVHRHALSTLNAAFRKLDWTPDSAHPIFLVEQARVAIGDAIGEAIGADLAVVLLGERPGLSSPDSLGIYLTWSPRIGRSDAERNCISNIHANGLSYELAAHKFAFLAREAQSRKLTGVALKENAGELLSMDSGERSISE